MAGGKETPRQKMIGMMYLVLTALLALNVSKSILDAFVAIESNIQKANVVQVDRGNGFIGDVRSELTSSNGEDQALKRKKLEIVLKKMDEINKETAAFIAFTDGLKLDILKEAGEAIDLTKNNDPETIKWTATADIQPAVLNLAAVQAQDKYDEPMYVLGINDDIKKPTGKGLELWNRLIAFRKSIVELTGSYKLMGDSQFKLSVREINDFKNNQELRTQVATMIDQNKEANLKEDRQVLIDLYMLLTKRERNKVHDQENVHWIGMTFDHSPLVGAIASLSSLQQDVLSARALALAHWRSKVGVGEYSFNQIVPLAYGQPIANTGDSVYLKVMMAAFDTDNQPKVVIQEGATDATVNYPQNGQGIVGFKVSGTSEQTVKGTVAIRNKQGIEKVEPWEYTVKIMKPSGAISIPAFNVLYRKYENVVSAVASGFDETRLSGQGVSVSKRGNDWVVTPQTGTRTATLTVTGINSVTGKSTSLLTQSYQVMTLPSPELYWGTSRSGETGGVGNRRLFAKYGPGIPLSSSFKVLSWSCEIPGAVGPPKTGTGDDISAAISLLRSAPRGKMVTFQCRVLNESSNTVEIITGSYKL